MKFKEIKEKIDTYIHIEEKLQAKNLELEKIEKKLEIKKQELEALKTEVITIKDFINKEFANEFKDFDYKVNLKHCYIISLNGKKYIAQKNHKTKTGDWHTLATGYYHIDTYLYYDALNLNKDGTYKFLHEYQHSYFSNPHFTPPRIIGQKPEYEKHILELYPELNIFIDNYVPNTYLKKIYYEINNLSNNPLIKKKKLSPDKN